MAQLKRELRRRLEGPEVTRRDIWALVFDTDTKRLYIEHEWTYLETRQGGMVECRTDAMDIAEYLMKGGQTTGHRELWRLLQTLFKEASGPDDYERV